MKQDVKKFGICRLAGWKVAGVVLVVLAMAGCSDACFLTGKGNKGSKTGLKTYFRTREQDDV